LGSLSGAESGVLLSRPLQFSTQLSNRLIDEVATVSVDVFSTRLCIHRIVAGVVPPMTQALKTTA
jgi:hypothetical protein